MMAALPDFDAAVEQFRDFVARTSGASDVLWVFREDIRIRRRGIWVRAGRLADNVGLARRQYEEGRRRGLGVLMSVFCRLGNYACSYVWIPADAEDAQYAMVSGLRLAAPEKVREASALTLTPTDIAKYLLAGSPVDDPFLADVPSQRDVP